MINIPDRPIALMLSGGFDSAVLLYLLCESGAKQVFCHTIHHRNSSYFAGKVVDYVQQKFPEVSLGHEILEKTSDNMIQIINEGYGKVIHDGFFLYDAATKNPSIEDLPDHPESRPPRATNYPTNLMDCPFLDIEKTEIIRMAHDRGILDELAAITHSCTETDGERCGQCWQCLERKVSFAKYNLVDVGIF
jgi:7-cyano-7-deazaguanine synthase in queuosine biosynthesis